MKLAKLLLKFVKSASNEDRLLLNTLMKENPEMYSAFVRRYFTDPVRKYSKTAPVYTKANAPKKMVVGKKDIGEFHMNDGSPGTKPLSPREAYTMVHDAFNNAEHGTIARIGESLNDANFGLSATSAPLFYNFGLKQQRRGLGHFIKPLGEPELVRPNKVSKWVADYKGDFHLLDLNFIDKVNEHVVNINNLGYNFPLARIENGQALIPNIGFLKFKKGGTLDEKIKLLQKRNTLVR